MNKSSTQYRIPSLCAWCGQRQPVATRNVQFNGGEGRKVYLFSLDLGICEQCQQNVIRYQKMSKTISWVMGIIWTVLAILLLPLFIRIPWLAFLVVPGVMVLGIVITKAYFKKKLPEGKPLQGPGIGKLIRKNQVHFTVKAYHEAFAQLNPHLVDTMEWYPLTRK